METCKDRIVFCVGRWGNRICRALVQTCRPTANFEKHTNPVFFNSRGRTCRACLYKLDWSIQNIPVFVLSRNDEITWHFLKQVCETMLALHSLVQHVLCIIYFFPSGSPSITLSFPCERLREKPVQLGFWCTKRPVSDRDFCDLLPSQREGTGTNVYRRWLGYATMTRRHVTLREPRYYCLFLDPGFRTGMQLPTAYVRGLWKIVLSADIDQILLLVISKYDQK